MMDLDANEKRAIEKLQERLGKQVTFQLRSVRGRASESVGRVLLNDSGLTDFPPELLEFPHIRDIELNGNQLTSIPSAIQNLKVLARLRLNYNHLRHLPSDIGNTRSLIELDLRGNQLEEIPPSFANLIMLISIDLRDNNLSELPIDLSKLVAPVVLSLSGNPLADPYPELLERGTDTLLTFLGSLKEGVPQYEAKLLLIGEGNVGKSSTLASLRGDDFNPSRLTTHGIELNTLVLPHPDGQKKIVLHTWDFGGQPVYRVTHQFFYSQRSLYLLAWRPREGVEQNAVESWLERLRLRLPSAGARVLVVATYADERLVDLDEPALETKYAPMVRGFHKIDNFTGRGVDELRARIAAEAQYLPQMGRPINPRWNAVRDELLGLREFFIKREAFFHICTRHNVSDLEGKTLLNLLHDLGRLIYYSDDIGLHDLVVLNPEWLTKAIGFVLEDEPTMQAGGVLDHARLKQMWEYHSRKGEPTYAAELHPYFLRLMEKYDISYRIRDTDKSLVGQMVPYQRPTIPSRPARTPYLSLQYVMAEEPPGIIPWLLVRSHRFSTGLHWRRGVFLEHEGHSALLEQDNEGKLLFVSVWGPAPDYFFHVVIDSIQHLITQRWPGLSYARHVPCPKKIEHELPCTGKFKLETLLRARERGIPTRSCDECFQEADVTELLTGFAPARERLIDRIESLHDKLENLEISVEPLNQVLALQRSVLNAMSSENRECPRLFTLWPKDPTVRDKLELWQRKYELWLWCDHPGCPHPIASYEIRRPKEWFVQVAGLASLVAKTLTIGLPVFGPAIKLMVDEATMKILEPRLALMEGTAKAFLKMEDVGTRNELMGNGLTEAQGAGMRALHHMLLEIDPTRHWGGLRRRVSIATGDWQWICEKHYGAYDPGLPKLPS